ncbi:hypothetical protein JDV02_001904 [Purpureocillium takamizusanense]|uniref:Uncharacterized protein n=1 Tax=Purpureocillium takamizusanense TaxID=2060973 RepID=A0A9Q8QAN2_9HYPO|nr:uncharacterized protein JDV02_001904 [Purpureocillium takamizusanense]UNI15367.1 hypothetical protein JDV02_001904 [Purpureocillium takamizusanense]
MEYYHRVRITAKSHKVFGTVAENLYLVLVTDEFDRQHVAAQADGSLDELRDQTIDLLFPGTMNLGSADKTAAELEEMKVKRRRSMYYRLRLGQRLLELVRRFGYGILVYPGFGCGDINDLKNDQVTAFITHMECCHPNMQEELNNLSHVVRVIVHWGLPPEELAIEMIPYKMLSKHQHRSFNELFTFPDRPDYVFSWIEPGSASNIPNWWSSPCDVLQVLGDLDAEKLQPSPPPYSQPPPIGCDGRLNVMYQNTECDC